MLQILHIDSALEMRGGQHQILTLARGLRERGHEQIIACAAAGRLESMARGEGFKTARLRFGGAGAVSTLWSLRNLARSVDIVHAHDGRSQTYSWLMSQGLPVKRIASRRVSFRPRGPLSHRLKYGRGCDGVIAISNFIREGLLQAGIPATKIRVIPDGIPIPAELPGISAQEEARRSFGLAPGDFAVGHAGAFTPEKGQEVAIQAFKLAQPRLSSGRLLLAGDGPLKPILEEKYCLKDPADGVRLTGYLADLKAFMSAIDLFVMPSVAEGLGSAALIAMAYGKPVIASRTGGLPEIVKPGDTGWLIPPGRPDLLAETLVESSSNPEVLLRLGANARKQAGLFTDDILVKNTEEFYLQVLHGSLP